MNQSIKTSHGVIALVAVLIIIVGMVNSRTPTTPDTVSISLTPDSRSVAVNGTFDVDIILDTAGQETYGVDINSLRFDPRILQVVDADTGTPGTQITSGSLMGVTVFNVADNTAGKVQFSQVTTPEAGQGGAYAGSGVLASVTFKVIAEGSANITLDFAPGVSTDSNVAGISGDMLSSVIHGTYIGY